MGPGLLVDREVQGPIGALGRVMGRRYVSGDYILQGTHEEEFKHGGFLAMWTLYLVFLR
jgi:hypothetical protein